MKRLDELPFILDGATGTQLQRRGMPTGVSPEKWILENPSVMAEIQRAYVKFGSNAVFAPTFGANRCAMRAHGITDSVHDYVSKLVSVSRDAVGGSALIGGDISPTGIQMLPVGNISFDEMIDIFAEQASALEEAGVDFFCIETQMSLGEARAAVTAARSVSEKPILVSFCCNEIGRTIYGGDLSAALVALQDMGIYAYGINCLGDLKLMSSLLHKMSRYASIPLIAKPNAGMPDMSGGFPVYGMSPSELTQAIPSLAEAGAGYFGGCCGTDERHIEAIASALAGLDITPSRRTKNTVAASECMITELGDDTVVADLRLDDFVSESSSEALEDGAELLYVRIRENHDIDVIESNQYAIKLPLCVECPDGELLGRLLRVYNGKPVLV